MTTDTKPTDAEIIALLGDRRYSTVGAVREAITRWGQPAHSGEPVAWRYRMSGDMQWQYTERKEQFSHASEVEALTNMQPVEREPLTDEWIRSRCKESWVFDTAKQWVRMTEAAHGIKGGQQ